MRGAQKKSKARPHLFSKTSCLFARPKKSKPAPSLYAHFFSFLALPCFFLFYFFCSLCLLAGAFSLYGAWRGGRGLPERARFAPLSRERPAGIRLSFGKRERDKKEKRRLLRYKKKDKATSRAQECDRGDRSAFSLCALLAVAHARAAAAPTFDQKKRKGMTPAGRIGQFLSILFIR